MATPSPPPEGPKLVQAEQEAARVESPPPVSAVHAGNTDETDSGGVLEDEPPPEVAPEGEVRPLAAHPLDGLSEDEVRRRVREDLASLGSISLGLPNAGALLNGVLLPADERWVVVDASHAHGTSETVDGLTRAIARVVAEVPQTPPLHIGHLSGPQGGHLAPHTSHQNGRDVDVGYYYTNGGTWYQRATRENLDVVRTWALVRTLIIETDVQFILIDRSIQELLRGHASGVGEDEAWLEDVFDGTPSKTPAMIRHVKGHATHMHVRFFSPVAQETARRTAAALVSEGKLRPSRYMTSHVAKKGDSLIKLAQQYDTTVAAIQRANGMRSTKIFARKTYKIPRTGPAPAPGKTPLPPRRLPAHPPRGAAAEP